MAHLAGVKHTPGLNMFRPHHSPRNGEENYYPHFTDGETEAWSNSARFPEAT